MSSQLPIPPLSDDSVSTEDQYVEIPEWHRELLAEAIARYRKVGIEGTPREDFEKELDDFIEEELNTRNTS